MLTGAFGNRKERMNDDTQQAHTSTSPTTGEDLAQAALSQAAATQSPTAKTGSDEVAESNEVAQTLEFLQNIIERNATELMRVRDELKLRRESLRSIFENDTLLSEAESQAEQYASQVKERKAQVVNSPQAVSLKNQVAELNEQKKEIEETLSNHLLNYYAMTNSTSFDTSDGDQWEFNIKAAVKSRKTE